MIVLLAAAASDASAGSNSLRDALIGGLIGSVLAIAAQWFLGPGIERRVRAQERWEEFLIELASLLHGPVKQAHWAARSAWMSWHYVQQLVIEQPDVDTATISEFNRRDKEAFAEALSVWRDSLTRPEWLAKRLTGDYGLAGQDLRRFYTRWMVYSSDALRWMPWIDAPREDPADWDKVQEDYKLLMAEVESLSTRIGLPVSLPARLWGRLRLWRERRRSRKRAAAAEAKSVAEAATVATKPPD